MSFVLLDQARTNKIQSLNLIFAGTIISTIKHTHHAFIQPTPTHNKAISAQLLLLPTLNPPTHVQPLKAHYKSSLRELISCPFHCLYVA